jgi:hypothetical protein
VEGRKVSIDFFDLSQALIDIYLIRNACCNIFIIFFIFIFFFTRQLSFW